MGCLVVVAFLWEPWRGLAFHGEVEVHHSCWGSQKRQAPEGLSAFMAPIRGYDQAGHLVWGMFDPQQDMAQAGHEGVALLLQDSWVMMVMFSIGFVLSINSYYVNDASQGSHVNSDSFWGDTTQSSTSWEK